EFAKHPSGENIITTGNLAIIRDFVDVRDVVRAYLLLLKKGRSGEIYNICSGKGTKLEDIIKKMSAILNISIQTAVNPALMRPNENKKIIGSYTKIKNELGWQPEIPIEQSLADIIAYWQQNIS
ncbi:MAG TPA: GDP-mannose 4,6-dehydratase, partial [Ignavibacteriaceae bacterium]